MSDKLTKFYYFAYGSNLCRQRLALSSPSLKKIAIGQLDRYALAFAHESKRWNGGVATVHESDNADDCVWGLIWEIDLKEKSALDDQEGVAQQVYRPLEVVIRMLNGEHIKCRTYQLTDVGGVHQYADPSPQYHQLILEGAMENDFPEDYINMLKNVKTNNNTETTEIMSKVAEVKGNSKN